MSRCADERGHVRLFSLPAAQRPSRAHRAYVSARKVHDPRYVVRERGKVLVIEDDPAVQVSLDELFAREGYEVLVASDGAEAIELLECDVLPCCALVDLLMPGIDGQEFLDYLSVDGRAAIPVAIITGSPELAPRGYRMFPKPLDTQALLDFVCRECPLPTA